MTGKDTRRPDNSWLTVMSTNLRTGLELVSASTPGNAEVPECAKDKAGAMEMMPAKKSMNDHNGRAPPPITLEIRIISDPYNRDIL